MATYTTLFSATHSELEARFPNVADPLPVPRIVTRTNPFTKRPIQLEIFEPEFGPPRNVESLHAAGGPPYVKPIHVQDDDFGRYLASLVPQRLRSLPHLGTKNISFLELEDLLQLGPPRPEKFVQCLAGEGCVQVASAQLSALIRANRLTSFDANPRKPGNTVRPNGCALCCLPPLLPSVTCARGF